MSDQLYKEYILELYRNPLNHGTLPTADSTYTAYNPACGDEITVDVSVDNTKTITAIVHRGQGCAIAIAAVSLMTELVKGRHTTEVLALTFADVVRELGVDIDYTRQKCAMIGLTAIQQAIHTMSDRPDTLSPS